MKFSANETAYRILREKILDGEFTAGEHLAEVTLAERTGVSRTPVRAALQRLEGDGLVEFKRNQGAVVRTLPAEEVDQIFALRQELESFAVALVAERIDADGLAALQDLCTQMETEAARPEPPISYIAQLNKQFHAKIIELSGNIYLQRFAVNLIDLNFMLRSYNRFSARDLERSMRHHRELTEAFAAGNPAWARGIMVAHVEAGRSLALSMRADEDDTEPEAAEAADAAGRADDGAGEDAA